MHIFPLSVLFCPDLLSLEYIRALLSYNSLNRIAKFCFISHSSYMHYNYAKQCQSTIVNCTHVHVLIAEKNPKYLSNQLKVEMFFAKNVYQNIENPDLKIDK